MNFVLDHPIKCRCGYSAVDPGNLEEHVEQMVLAEDPRDHGEAD